MRRLLADLCGCQGDLETGRAFTTRSITRTRIRQGAGQGSECQREVRSIGKIGSSQRRVDSPLRNVIRETSDFIVDCLENWWEDRKDQHTHIHDLVINLDHGPELGSGRRQFIQRMIEFADRYPLNIHLVYYPPHHRTYNPMEHVWGILENHWNRTLLTDRETAIEWAKTMTWKSISAIVKMLAGTCETGVKVGTQAFNSDKNVSVVTNHFPSAT